ncbi:MAG: hypothetical protein ABWZ26_00040 [Candidatus Nanopelagicales bacterium]
MTPECGRTYEPSSGGPLSIVAHLPAAVGRNGSWFEGTVEITSADHGVLAVMAPFVDLFLVRDGLIVALPPAQDLIGRTLVLAVGGVETLPAHGSLVPCDTRRFADGVLSAAGPYAAYARVVLNHDDGTNTESVGWTVVPRGAVTQRARTNGRSGDVGGSPERPDV